MQISSAKSGLCDPLPPSWEFVGGGVLSGVAVSPWKDSNGVELGAAVGGAVGGVVGGSVGGMVGAVPG